MAEKLSDIHSDEELRHWLRQLSWTEQKHSEFSGMINRHVDGFYQMVSEYHEHQEGEGINDFFAEESEELDDCPDSWIGTKRGAFMYAGYVYIRQILTEHIAAELSKPLER